MCFGAETQTWSRAASVLGTSISQPGAWACSFPAVGSILAFAGWVLAQAKPREVAGCPPPVVKLCEGHPPETWLLLGLPIKFTTCFFVFNSSVNSLVTCNPIKSAQQKVGYWEQSVSSLHVAHLSQMVQTYLPCSSRLNNCCKSLFRRARNRGKKQKRNYYLLHQG